MTSNDPIDEILDYKDLTSKLRQAEKILGFYADINNWQIDTCTSHYNAIKSEDISVLPLLGGDGKVWGEKNVGGRKAREFFKEHTCGYVDYTYVALVEKDLENLPLECWCLGGLKPHLYSDEYVSKRIVEPWYSELSEFRFKVLVFKPDGFFKEFAYTSKELILNNYFKRVYK